MMTEKEEKYFDLLVEYGVATAAELCLVFDLLAGDWTITLDSVCYARTGYRTVEQWVREEVEADE